jgi:hypothetical protein
MSAFSTWTQGRMVAMTLAAAGLAVGCVAGDSTSGGGSAPPYIGGGASSSGGSSGGSTGTAGSQPLLVDVDPNRTMTAAPGQGVGVFTEYQTGGHWHVWWTCDTSKTDLGCSFEVSVSVASGTIANVAGQSLQTSDRLAQPTSQQVEATTTTTTGIDGVTFDTPLDASGDQPVITLDVKLNGQEDGSFLFFVQDGKINGGYQGTVTDPLMLEPSTP